MNRKKVQRSIIRIVEGVLIAVIGGLLLHFIISALPQQKEPDGKITPNSSLLTLGVFEQDNNTSNGAEPIEWIVLYTNEENEILLVSKYGLLYKPFEEGDLAHVWGESSLRSWLNSVFFDDAFSAQEKDAIILHRNITEASSTYYSGGEDTYSNDYVFCLSIQEVNEFFNPREDRICIPTNYAMTTFAGGKAQPNGDHWWLRNPGVDLSNIACVRGYGEPEGKPGSINEYGSHSNVGGILVRPAMWVSLDRYLELRMMDTER